MFRHLSAKELAEKKITILYDFMHILEEHNAHISLFNWHST